MTSGERTDETDSINLRVMAGAKVFPMLMGTSSTASIHYGRIIV
jgi:hypothetical protein